MLKHHQLQEILARRSDPQCKIKTFTFLDKYWKWDYFTSFWYMHNISTTKPNEDKFIDSDLTLSPVNILF